MWGNCCDDCDECCFRGNYVCEERIVFKDYFVNYVYWVFWVVGEGI